MSVTLMIVQERFDCTTLPA